MQPLNLAFLGSSEFVIPILENVYFEQNNSLLKVFEQQFKVIENLDSSFRLEQKTYYEICRKIEKYSINLGLIITQPDRQNRNKIVSNPVKIFAEKHQLLSFTPEKLNREVDFLTLPENCFDLAITASYGQIISSKILNLPKYGFINWHPSNLPKYRGPTPIQASIFEGVEISALSWIEMTKEMDAGDILLQIPQIIEFSANFSDTALKMGRLGAKTWALAAALQIAAKEGLQIPRIRQNEAEVTFCKMLQKDDKYVQNSKLTAVQIYNHFRAFQQFPGTSLLDKYFTPEFKITGCQADNVNFNETKTILFENENWLQIKSQNQIITFLKCAEQTLLKVNCIVLSDGKKIDFRGYLMGEK